MTETIFRGEDRDLLLRTVKSLETKEPRPLGGPSEIVVKFKNADDTELEKKLTTGGITIVSDDRGDFKISITAAESALLAIVNEGDICATITTGGLDRIAQFEKVLTVTDCQ